MGPCDLNELVKSLPYYEDPRVIAGSGYSDDAGVFRLNENTVIVQTVDFFPPMVDDPYIFGQIAAANSLSDIYAMGGEPVTALNIAGFPSDISKEIISLILKGGIDKAREAGAAVLGGHTVVDKEIKYGMAVTGVLSGDFVTANTSAYEGDILVLTKPLGIGIITTAIKRNTAPLETIKTAVKVMCRLNNNAAKGARAFQAHSVTDITGFGLMGHALNMAKASNKTFTFYSEKIPVIRGTEELLQGGAYPGGSKRNRAYVESFITWDSSVPEHQRQIFTDAQTSGGLLISVDPVYGEKLVKNLIDSGDEYAAIIGHVSKPNTEDERIIYVR